MALWKDSASETRQPVDLCLEMREAQLGAIAGLESNTWAIFASSITPGALHSVAGCRCEWTSIFPPLHTWKVCAYLPSLSGCLGEDQC